MYFENQVVLLNRWIADFVCADLRLIIEVDGKEHSYGKRRKSDTIRDTVMAIEGFSTMRFTNEEVLKELPRVVSEIRAAARTLSDAKGRTPYQGHTA